MSSKIRNYSCEYLKSRHHFLCGVDPLLVVVIYMWGGGSGGTWNISWDTVAACQSKSWHPCLRGNPPPHNNWNQSAFVGEYIFPTNIVSKWIVLNYTEPEESFLTCGYVDIGNCQSHPWSGFLDCHPSPSVVTSYHKLQAPSCQLPIFAIS